MKRSLGPPSPGREIHLDVLFLHLVAQQEDLIAPKAAPRVPIHPADLELCSVGGTVVKDGVREDRRQAEGPACWVPHCHLEAEPHSIQVVVPALLFYGNLEGVVVGLDALIDGLFQVPLLYTLDPQVLEAVDAAVWAELSLIEAIPAVFPHELMGVRPVRGSLVTREMRTVPGPV